MFVSIFISALFGVCPSAIAITLPNGFTLDETQYLQLESRANYALEKCERPDYYGCSSDCTSNLFCDENSNVIDSYPCNSWSPYCVKNSYYSMCSGNFPMNNQECLTKATNSFICTDDGQFPDPTDCNKYHICNGTAHTIAECPGSSRFSSDRNILDPFMNPGNGEFSCRFISDQEFCMCDRFNCEGMPNAFTFRMMDFFHYAYCLEIGTVKKVAMFKCPSGTSHNGMVSITNSVDCTPIGAPLL